MISRRVSGIAAVWLAALAFSGLGVWQIARGQARQAWLEAQSSQVPTAIRGTYLADRQLLLDGQAHDGTPGYEVWTPLRRADGQLLIVNRGWVPQPAPALPAPGGEILVSGVWRSLPQPALRLEAGPCRPAAFPAVVQYPRDQELSCLLGAPVLNGVLLLDAKEPGGFVRQWNVGGFPPARHYAYAAQWFGLALVAAVMLIRLSRGSKT